MKKPAAKSTETQTVALPVRTLIDLPPESLGEIVWSRIQDAIEAHIHGQPRIDAARRLGDWFSGLGGAHAAAFFETMSEEAAAEDREAHAFADGAAKLRAAKAATKPKAPPRAAPRKGKALTMLPIPPEAKPAPKRASKPKPWERHEPIAKVGPNDPLWSVPGKDPKQPELFGNTSIAAGLDRGPTPRVDEDESEDEDDRADDGFGGHGSATAKAEADHREFILGFLRDHPISTALEIRTYGRLSEGQTKGLLKRLREQGAIKVDGKNKGARYSLATASTLNGASAHA